MFKRFTQVKFSTKLIMGMIISIVISILLVSSVTIGIVLNKVLKLGTSNLKDIHDTVYTFINDNFKIINDRLTTDMVLITEKLDSFDSIYLNQNYIVSKTIIDQITHNRKIIKMPSMYIGNINIHEDTTFVDYIKSNMQCAATIFQLVDDTLIRVSTNVVDSNDYRFTNTYINSDSPIYQAIKHGKSYRGVVYIVDKWYAAYYNPIKDTNTSNIIGAIFVGKPLLNDDVYNYISRIRLSNSGYFYIYDSTGRILIHPTIENKNIFELPDIGNIFKNIKDEYIEYEYNNEVKVAYVKYLPNHNWYIGVGLNKEQIIQGIDIEIIKYSIIIGIISILLGIALVYLFIKVLSSILTTLSSKSMEVADGNYLVKFEYTINDVIGDLSRAISKMITNTTQLLVNIKNSCTVLNESTYALSEVANDIYNTTTTTVVAVKTITKNSDNVKENMTSISAAIEELSTNINTIASATEEMTTTILEISTNTTHARNISLEAVAKADHANKSMHSLSTAATQITSIIDSITKISSQTNLLALNATIEAARAGDNGKEFAVVANAIKELARQTSNSTEDIRIMISDIVKITDSSTTEIYDIIKIIHDINNIINTIAAAIEQQSTTAKEISNSLSQIVSSIHETNTLVNDCTQSTINISTDIHKVNNETNDLKNNIDILNQHINDLNNINKTLSSLLLKYTIE